MRQWLLLGIRCHDEVESVGLGCPRDLARPIRVSGLRLLPPCRRPHHRREWRWAAPPLLGEAVTLVRICLGLHRRNRPGMKLLRLRICGAVAVAHRRALEGGECDLLVAVVPPCRRLPRHGVLGAQGVGDLGWLDVQDVRVLIVVAAGHRDLTGVDRLGLWVDMAEGRSGSSTTTTTTTTTEHPACGYGEGVRTHRSVRRAEGQ